MPKPPEVEPIPQQPKYLSAEAVEIVIDRLLQKQQSFTSLKLEDIGRYGQQTELDANPESLIRQVLGADHSLIEEAYHQLLKGLPEPTEVPDLTHYDDLIKNGRFISPEDEKKIREATLKVEQPRDSLEHLRILALKETQELNKLIRSLSREIPGSLLFYSTALDPIEWDMALLEMLSKPPTISGFGSNKPRYRLKVPFSTDLYLVVDSDEDNAKVNELLFRSPNLMAYFVAEQVQRLQQYQLKKAESIFKDTSTEKHKAFERQSAEINLSVRAHFLELLKAYCQERGQLTMVKIFRDPKDHKHITEGLPPIANRTGIETFKYTYTIRLDELGRVELLMKTHSDDVQCSFEVVADSQGQPTIQLQTPVMREANEYCPLHAPLEHQYRFDSDVQSAQHFIDSVRICSTSQLLAQPTGIEADLQAVSRALCAEESLVGFFQGLRSITSLYPQVEFVLVTKDIHPDAFDNMIPPRSVWGESNPN